MYKSKRTHVAILIIVVLAVLLGVGNYIKTNYTVRTVYVEGNIHYTEDEIKRMVMDGILGDNSLYLSFKYKNKDVKGIPFVDVLNVDILSADTIKITVYEKSLTGYVKYLDTYVYFDRDGYVVENSNIKTVGIPQVTGLEFDHIIVGEPIPVEDKEVFQKILDITKLLNKYNLISDKIYFNKSGEITVFFENVKVALGGDRATLEDKLMLLPKLLQELSGKKGTLQMQTYDEDSGKYTFQPEKSG
ncbi:MAG: cell division protein FtsQ [Lachnospiraceae bacterium]|nr:cell division protein FtsQ [Lachnospiraceae bacterium]